MRDKKNIDDQQAATVEEHFDELIKDESCIDETTINFSLQDLPEWYNEDLFKAGQRYYQQNLLAMSAVSLIGVLAVIIIPTILRVLVWTKQSGTTCAAFKRYLETIIHIHTLYTEDINDPNSRWWKSLNAIRWKHATSSRRCGQSGTGKILQRDMALTQFGFLGYALLVPEKLGLTNEPHQRKGLIHFWRIVGFALGIQNKMNICRKDEAETTALCRKLQDNIYVKHMNNEPEKFHTMALALLNGLWYVDPMLDAESNLYLWYNISGLEYKKPLGLGSRLNYKYRKSIVYLLGVPVVGYVVREFFNYYLIFCYWAAENWPVLAWIRFGTAHTKINLYPHIQNKSTKH